MRFELKIEPLFSQLAADLGITFDPFTFPRSGQAKFPKYDIQPHEFSTKHKQALKKRVGKGPYFFFSHHTSALDLLKFGIYRMFHQEPNELKLSLAKVVSGAKRSRISQYAGSLTEDHYHRIRTKQTLDGERLYTLGFWNALSRVLSPGAVAKIRDTGTFYHLMPENPSASEWAIFWLRLFRPDADLSTIKGGVETIVERLANNLTDQGLLVNLNSTVERIEPGADGKVRLKIAGHPDPKEFDHVILAIPAVPMSSLSEEFPQDIQKYVNGVIAFPLLKIFVVIQNPWWKELPEPQQGAHLVPTREIHYFPSEDGSRDKAMIMLYTDRPATAFWHPYTVNPHTGAQIGRTLALKRQLAHQVAHLLPRGKTTWKTHVDRVEESIIDFALRDWSEPPFSAACHAWPPQVKVPEVLERLKAFCLEGARGPKNVHICGEAYSDYQGFIEGALRSASEVVASI